MSEPLTKGAAFLAAVPATIKPSEAKTDPKHTWVWSSVSPSQITTYRKCPRKWYEQSVLGTRGPQSESQMRGDAIHKALEVYMETGEVLPTVTMKDSEGNDHEYITVEYVQVASSHIPPPIVDDAHWAALKKNNCGIMVEQKGELGSYSEGPGITQRIDLTICYVDEAEITDYKTTSDFRYCKTPEELSQDTQLCLNAKWLFSISDYKEITIGHLYLLTKNKHPKAKPVRVKVNREQVDKVFDRDMVSVREMQNWAKLAPPNMQQLPPNTKSCDEYGGCEFRSKCFGAGGLGGFGSSPSLFQIKKTDQPTNGVNTTMPDGNSMLAKMMNAAKPAAGSGPPPGVAALFAKKAPTEGAPAAAATPAPAVKPDAVIPPAGALPGPKAPALPGAKAAAVLPGPKAPAAVVGFVAPATVAAPPVALAAVKPNIASLFKKKAPDVAPATTAPASPPPAADPVPPTEEAPAMAEIAVGGLTPGDAPSDVSTPEEVAAANPETPATAETAEGAAEADSEGTAEGTASEPGPSAEAMAAAAAGEAPKRKRRTKAEMETARAAAVAATGQPNASVTPLVPVPSDPPPGNDGTVTEAPAAATGAYTQEMTEAFSDAQAAPAELPQPTEPAPLPAAPVVDGTIDEIRKALESPDASTYACPVQVLFIDCQPLKGWPGEAPRHLFEYMHAFERAAASSAKALDYRLIRFESKGWLSTAIRVMMKGLPSAIIVDTRTPGADEFISIVAPYAAAVFRGTR